MRRGTECWGNLYLSLRNRRFNADHADLIADYADAWLFDKVSGITQVFNELNLIWMKISRMIIPRVLDSNRVIHVFILCGR